MPRDELPKIRALPPGKKRGRSIEINLEELANDLVNRMDHNTIFRIGYRGVVRMVLNELSFRLKIADEERRKK